ncbi:alpha/beta fold hydrolase [Geodermatophilus chilensis]|uniref:alpha/beta fold hydrolase n=1 Tax=Geodermatophilus chilensis TaxID=2035835 RepID=UPI000C2683E1|nr:alpha/beta hydrolase [Geodermatophilus chilensis]
MGPLTRWDTHEFTAAAGTRVHAALLGPADAPTVVCVHGLGCSHRYFLPLARALRRDARVVAPDLPGFGRTRGPVRALDVRGQSRALADWLRATARGGAVLVANSTGCQVAVDMAVHSPELLGPLVLVGPTVDRRARTLPQQVARLVANSPWERPTLGLALVPAWIACGARRYVETFGYVLTDPIERKLPHVPVPTVVVRGGRDPVVPRAWAEEVTRHLPRGRLEEVPGVGHTVNWSAPERLAQIVRPLLAGEPA